ncbi:hypothetical protein D7030_01285 [Flavobacteriaceae bacterium AU392]|nr:hypothetical protein D1817_07740 [Flavobacteriaceae bacterium]RKM86512.1 hypothetical protein D7030_01285 [Flavobacteriaceae bacterium AU392]
MKQLLTLSLLLISLNCISQSNDFIGKWAVDGLGSDGIISFDKEKNVILYLEGQTLGGDDYQIEGKKASFTYEINYKTNPIQLDFIYTLLETGEQYRILFLAKFTGKNDLLLATSSNNVRPIEFKTENTMILKRKE